jgi:hypothetical protein
MLTDEEMTYRTYKTVIEMLSDRGYNIQTNKDVSDVRTMTLKEFNEMRQRLPNLSFYTTREVELEPELYLEEEKNPEERRVQKEPILVYFDTDSHKIDKPKVALVVEHMLKYAEFPDNNEKVDCLNAILILRGTITSIAKKFLDTLDPYVIEPFM